MSLPGDPLRATDVSLSDRNIHTREPFSFQDLYWKHEPAVRRWIQKCARREEEVEDLVQETFVKAWIHLPQFRGEAKLTTWLFRIATNEVRQLYRRQRTRDQRHRLLTGCLRQEELLVDPNAFSLTTMMEADIGARLRAIIQNLPKPMQDTITLRDLEEVPICQAATRLGLTISALKTRHFRARRELKRHLLQKASSLSYSLQIMAEGWSINKMSSAFEMRTKRGKPFALYAEQRVFVRLASLDRFGMAFLRLALVIVLLWIGGLKFVSYEANSIVPLVANRPALRFLYHFPAPEYRLYRNRAGEFIPEHWRWQVQERYVPRLVPSWDCYCLDWFLACTEPSVAAGSRDRNSLLILMAATTLAFLVTTPETWVPALGDTAHGFPFPSGVGRLIIEKVILFRAAIVTFTDSVKASLRRLAHAHL